jgi:uncharacterized protein YaiI (UPF0178 family)
MLRIFIDGDACPVKDEIVRVATRHSLQTYLVSNQGMRRTLGLLVQGILVGPEFDAADNWIVEHITANDIVITSDIQLAGRCLKKASQVINPNGKIFTDDNIGSSLAMRELNSYLREVGEAPRSNPSFSKQHRSDFLQALDLIIQKNIKKR